MPRKYFEIKATSGYYNYSGKAWTPTKTTVTALLVEETFDTYVLEHSHIMQEGDDPAKMAEVIVRTEYKKDDPKIKPKNIQTEFFLLRHKQTGRYHTVGSSSAPRLYNTYNKAKANYKDDPNWEVFPVVVGESVLK